MGARAGTRRPFPLFKPNALFYRQPVYYMSNHLNFVPSGSVSINGRTVSTVISRGMQWSIGDVLAHASRGEQLFPVSFSRPEPFRAVAGW